jgi:hypothetical protein
MVNNLITKLEPLLREVYIEGEKTKYVNYRRIYEEAEVYKRFP